MEQGSGVFKLRALAVTLLPLPLLLTSGGKSVQNIVPFPTSSFLELQYILCSRWQIQTQSNWNPNLLSSILVDVRSLDFSYLNPSPSSSSHSKPLLFFIPLDIFTSLNLNCTAYRTASPRRTVILFLLLCCFDPCQSETFLCNLSVIPDTEIQRTDSSFNRPCAPALHETKMRGNAYLGVLTGFACLASAAVVPRKYVHLSLLSIPSPKFNH
ncbi:hypothetical protein GE09DRAFT_361403 [Coniochaeta sp. 2T2.1]|nr:hypothetical protein GE09DRAFT_361403 [Coniochaeta sp. 2T2.1]